MKAAQPTLEELAEVILDDIRAGKRRSKEYYARRNPSLSDEIPELLSSIEMMERISNLESTARQVANEPVKQAAIKGLGEFEIVREIGRGGMGVVYEATDSVLGRSVALKVLHASTVRSPKRVERFQREAKLAAKLHHTNIVSVFGVGEENGTHFYAMQHIEGVNVEEVLDAMRGSTENESIECARNAAAGLLSGQFSTNTKVPEERIAVPAGQNWNATTRGLKYWHSVASIGVQVADALQYAHGHGILHRDIKPANLLFDESGIVWVADFGLAKLAELDDITQTGDVVGTLRYMAPEQLAGKADQRTDVYALGLTLYELLTLKPAMDGASYKTVVEQKQNRSFASPKVLDPSIPVDLETIVLKALAPDPGQRYQSASKLADDLRRYLDDRSILARRVSSAEQLWRWCKRNRMVASLLATTASLLLLLPLVFGWAYASEAELRRRSERTLHVALDGFDELYRSFLADDQALVEALSEDEFEESQVPNASELATATLTKDSARILERMLVFYDRLAQENAGSHDGELAMESAKARHRVGDLYRRLGEFSKATAAYQQAIERFEQAGGSHIVEIARIQNAIGEMQTQQHEHFEAHESYKLALELLGDKGAGDPVLLLERARTHYLLGRSEEHFGSSRGGGRGRGPSGRPGGPPPRRTPAGHADRRLEHLQSAIACLDLMPSKTTPDQRFLLALCLRDGSKGAIFEEGSDSARARAATLLNQLVTEFPLVPKYRYELSETYRKVGLDDLRRSDVNQVDRAIDQLEVARRLAEQLVREQDQVASYRFSLAHIYTDLGDLYSEFDSMKQAESYTQQAIDSHRRVVQDFPGLVSLAERLSVAAKFRLAVSLQRQFRWEESIAQVRPTAVALHNRLRRQDLSRRDSVRLRSDFAEAKQFLVRAYDRLGNDEKYLEVLMWTSEQSAQEFPVFSLLDKDANGTVSEIELEHAPSVLRSLDLDGNGTLTEHELIDIFPRPIEPIPPRPPFRPLTRGRFVEAVLSHDSDGDGEITREELPRRMAKGWFRRIDDNIDGVIERRELDEAFHRNMRRRGE